MLLFCGILATEAQLPRFWIFMIWDNPFHYLIEGMLTTGAAHAETHCTSREFVVLPAPGNQTCGEYMAPYFSSNPGYLFDDNATDKCLL